MYEENRQGKTRVARAWGLYLCGVEWSVGVGDEYHPTTVQGGNDGVWKDQWCELRRNNGFYRRGVHWDDHAICLLRLARCCVSDMSVLVCLLPLHHSSRPPISLLAPFQIEAQLLTLQRFLGALTTDARKIANLAGFYKGIQSAGGAVSFHINTLKINPIHELLMCWGLLFGALVVATPLIVKKVEDV